MNSPPTAPDRQRANSPRAAPDRLPVNSPPTAPDRLPHVSVVVPARDCAAAIGECLSAIGAQTYRGAVDVTVAVAPSHDGTAQAVASAGIELPVRVVENPAGTAAAGLNLAVAASEGPVVARVDAQSRIPPGYLERAVSTLARTGAANVGGVQRPVGAEGLPGAIAAAIRSPFGGGPAAFRRGRHSGPADTVYLGVFDRDALESVGGFDETLGRNQDYELNWRLREQGRTVWLDPSLVVDYVPRSDYSGLARQYFAYGAWKRTVLVRNPRSLRIRQFAAPALVAGLACSAFALALGRLRGAALPVLYAGACAAAAIRMRGVLLGRLDRARAAAAFAVMHLSWGAGFLAGRARNLRAAAQRAASESR
ncbi:MAG: glycosyltransferase family 2 protein [Acidimicrobiaceae bacterium]|nr:glycosyltransferase family 2 protein [Acidimicrobiaceae bacterium]